MGQRVKILIGISGSGKSTWASNFIQENVGWARVNRDDIRKVLVGKLDSSYYKRSDLRKLETVINHISISILANLLNSGFNVIVDNTHLKQSYINELLKYIPKGINIEYEWFSIHPESAKKRISVREIQDAGIDLSYIDRQYKDYKKLYEARGKIN